MEDVVKTSHFPMAMLLSVIHSRTGLVVHQEGGVAMNLLIVHAMVALIGEKRQQRLQ